MTKEQQKAAEVIIWDGDAYKLEQLLVAYKDDPFVKQWDEALKVRLKESVSFYEKACAIIAFSHHFNDWSSFETFKNEIKKEDSSVAIFEKAADAVVSGNMPLLNQLLGTHPGLIHARSVRNHHATLLNYVGANGVENFRQKTPPDAVEVAETLLKAGATVNAMGDMYRGTTTLGLVATSIHPLKAGLQKELINILLQHGADINHAVAPDYTDGLLINACLHNGRGEIVAYLADQGATLDLEGAAGTGIVDEVKKYYDKNGVLKEEASIIKRDLGFMWACCYGHKPVVDFMLNKGFDLSTLADGMTALHAAVMGGDIDITRLLLEHKAPLEIKNCYGGTVLGQALWLAYNDPKPQYPQIIDMLIEAGAVVEPGWSKYINDIRTGKIKMSDA